MRRFRFHIPAVPHTVTNKNYLSCAYTQKVHKLCGMLTDLGHEVFHYGCEGSDPRCTENIQVVGADYRREFYNTDYTREQFHFDVKDEYHRRFHARCVEEINKRKRHRDFLLCAWGWGHEPIARGVNDGDIRVVESGIGYEATFSEFRVFESYTWMAHVYGLNKQVNGSWYDCVIPNFFDANDFDFREDKEDWFLYLGRLVHRKGVDVAAQVTREIGAKLVVAGQGSLVNPSENLNITDSHVEHAGFADLAKRRNLLSRAKAVFMPTYYIEPFGGVSIEAALSGTPVISSDWGVFAENILDGVTGYRCRTLDQFCKAAESVGEISPQACRDWAADNFSMERVAAMYHEYFDMLYDVWDKGWYQRRPEKKRSDWLKRAHPSTPLDASPAKEKNGGRRVNINRRPRIAIWTQTDWAFGRIYGDLQKSLAEFFHLALLDWTRKGYDLPGSYDLVKIAVADLISEYQRQYPAHPSSRVISAIHGKAELISYDAEQGIHARPTEQMVDDFVIRPGTLEMLKSFAALGCVSSEIKELLASKYGLRHVVLSRAGFDPKIFQPETRTHHELRVLYPLRRDSGSHHHYNAKRINLVLEAEKRLRRTNPRVRFIFPDRLLRLYEMADFYRSADVHVCVSHSEGGPLVGIESAGCGLAQISTPAGIMSELITDGENGFLLREKQDEDIVRELCLRIQELDDDRARLHRFKKAMAETAHTEWTWERRRHGWRELFERGLEANARTDGRSTGSHAARIAASLPPSPLNEILTCYAEKRADEFYFVQVGANDGILADPILPWIRGMNWRGIMIEPRESDFRKLTQTHATSARIIFENLAVADPPGERELLYVRPEAVTVDWQRGIGSFYRNKNALGNLPDAALARETVQCRPLDWILDKHNAPVPDLLQIDAEGHDYEVLKTMNLDRRPPAIVHYEIKNLAPREQAGARILLRSRGYKILEYGEDALAWLPRRVGDVNPTGADNVFLHALPLGGNPGPARDFARVLKSEFSDFRHVVLHNDEGEDHWTEELSDANVEILRAPMLTPALFTNLAPRIAVIHDPEGADIQGEHPYAWLRESHAFIFMAHHRPTQPLINGHVHLFFDEETQSNYSDIRHLMGECHRVSRENPRETMTPLLMRALLRK